MAESSFLKWPVEIKLVKISSNTLNPEMDTYFITGLMNNEQCATLEEKLTILAKFRVDIDRIVISTVSNRQQLLKVLEICKKLSKSWRGQYQVVMKEFTQVCEDELKS
jgi:hypothetical protein